MKEAFVYSASWWSSSWDYRRATWDGKTTVYADFRRVTNPQHNVALRGHIGWNGDILVDAAACRQIQRYVGPYRLTCLVSPHCTYRHVLSSRQTQECGRSMFDAESVAHDQPKYVCCDGTPREKHMGQKHLRRPVRRMYVEERMQMKFKTGHETS